MSYANAVLSLSVSPLSVSPLSFPLSFPLLSSFSLSPLTPLLLHMCEGNVGGTVLMSACLPCSAIPLLVDMAVLV